MKHAAVREYKRKRRANTYSICSAAMVKNKLPGSQQQLAMATHIKVPAVLHLFHSQQRQVYILLM
jgi:hypothetical protein